MGRIQQLEAQGYEVVDEFDGETVMSDGSVRLRVVNEADDNDRPLRDEINGRRVVVRMAKVRRRLNRLEARIDALETP